LINRRNPIEEDIDPKKPLKTNVAASVLLGEEKYFDSELNWQMMQSDSNGIMGILFRYQDRFNYYTFEYSLLKLRFKKMH